MTLEMPDPGLASPVTFETPNYSLALPEIWVLCAACAILVVDLFSRDSGRRPTFWLSQIAVLIGIVLTISTQWGIREITFSGAYVADSVGTLLKTGVLVLVFLAFAYSREYLAQRKILKGEFYTLGLLGALGMMVMISAHSLISLYIGLELMSLCTYALVALNRDSLQSSEAAMKYFVLGALASGVLLYGLSMLYGASGSLDITEIAQAAGGNADSPLFVLGLVFVLAGVAFKFGAVPFHMWVPDVYQGAPTVISQYIATASKVAAVGLFVRLIYEGLGPLAEHWRGMLIVLAVLSLAAGNILALVQTNLKRLYGYSAFNHIGFIFLGFVSAAGSESQAGMAAAGFYAVSYALTVAATFGVIMLLSREGFEADNLDDVKGLSERSGLFAFVMLLLMISLTGIPGTVGFYAKWMVIQSLVDAGLVWLAIVAVIAAVVGAFYYLRIVKLIYFEKPSESAEPIQASAGFRTVLAINGFAVLALGFFPGRLIDAARLAFGA